MKRVIQVVTIILLVSLLSQCKAKRCANFDNAKEEYKVKYDRHGRVKR